MVSVNLPDPLPTIIGDVVRAVGKAFHHFHILRLSAVYRIDYLTIKCRVVLKEHGSVMPPLIGGPFDKNECVRDLLTSDQFLYRGRNMVETLESIYILGDIGVAGPRSRCLRPP